MINTQKGMRPIYSPLDRTSLVNKGVIIWRKSERFPCGTNAGNLEGSRWAHLARSGSQSECRIHFTLPVRGFYIIESFRFEDDYKYEMWLKVFLRILKTKTPRKASFYHFSLKKLALLTSMKKVTPSRDRKMIKLLTFDNLFPPLRHSR